MENEIVNKVAQSGLINFDLEDYYPKGKRVALDLAPRLFMGMILKEKDFREWIREEDWSAYRDTWVAVHCSADAIIPVWAYMLVASALEPFAKRVVMGSLEMLETALYQDVLNTLDLEPFRDQRVIIKGCGNLPVPEAAYVIATSKLQPVVKSLMYGEACSTVPVYKAAKRSSTALHDESQDLP